MIRTIATRFLTAVALCCASVAWSGWAYLHTVADPHRVERVADAVLEDPDARLELASPLAEQIVDRAGLDVSIEPQIRDAVVAAMADPRVTANLTDAVGSAHARSFGVPDARSGAIDGTLLLGAVRDHLASTAPDVAALVPTDLVGEITVPEFELPYAAGLRDLAEAVTLWLGAAAIGLLTFLLIVGNRSATLRRYGYWAIAAGLFWAVGPRLLVLAARRFASSVDATLAAGVDAATSTVTVAAMILVATGIAALVAGYALRLAPSGGPADRTPILRRAPRRERLPARPRRSPTLPTERSSSPPASTTVVVVPPPLPPFTGSAPRTAVMPIQPASDITAPTPNVRAGDLPLAPSSPPAPPLPEPPGEDDIDPWAHFAGPPVDPTAGDEFPDPPPGPPWRPGSGPDY